MLPDGKTVAGQLPRTPTAVRYSHGTAHAAPGTANAGGMSLYAAVKLASDQPRAPRTSALSRPGGQYYLFGAPRSASCAAAASDVANGPYRWPALRSRGPGSEPDGLRSTDLPPGVRFSDGHVLEAPQGWVVLQAASAAPAATVPPLSSTARYFVLRDRPALSSRQLESVALMRLNGQPTSKPSSPPPANKRFTS